MVLRSPRTVRLFCCALLAAAASVPAIAAELASVSPVKSVVVLSKRHDGASVSGESTQPIFSPLGSSVAFTSTALGLVEKNAPQSFSQIYLVGVDAGNIKVMSSTTDGVIGNGRSVEPAFSNDSQLIAFTTNAKNLTLSPNYFTQVVIKNRLTNKILVASSDEFGKVGHGASMRPSFLSNVGTNESIVFETNAPNLVKSACHINCPVNIVSKNLKTEVISVLSKSKIGHVGDGDSHDVDFNQSGTLAVFWSNASNLIDGVNYAGVPSQIYMKNLQDGSITIASSSSTGNLGNEESYSPKVSPTGADIAFISKARNLGPGGVGGDYGQLYTKHLAGGPIKLISKNIHGIPANFGVESFSYSPDGSHIGFVSKSTNLAPNATDNQIYLVDLASGNIVLISKNINGTISDAPCIGTSFSQRDNAIVFASKSQNLVPIAPKVQSNVFMSTLK